MPGTYTYPGVYVEEIPSGVRTIVGVSTSDTAFIDYFKRGPMNEPVRITSFGDFERQFGGLDLQSEASYAIRQYYLNGGSVAWVVRVAAGNPGPAERSLLGGSPAQPTLTVKAANSGEWGNNLQVVAVAITEPATSDRFNLVIRELAAIDDPSQIVNTETYFNLSMDKDDARYAVDVVNDASALVRLEDAGLGAMPITTEPNEDGSIPDSAFEPLTGGSNGNVPDSNELIGSASGKTGIHALEKIAPNVFNLLCLPSAAELEDNSMRAAITAATKYCEDKRAFLVVDIPDSVDSEADMRKWMKDHDGLRHRNAAVYFPRLLTPDPLNENRLRNVGASGTVAGVFARTDATRGVWKAPAGTEAELRGARLAVKLNDLENGGLNPLGVNVLRTFPVFGNIGWGARTLDGADQKASEWKYIPVRRLALYIEETLYQNLKWVVFEPNDEPLWAQIRLNVGAFMQNLFRQGAFQGTSPREAYLVKCDAETTTQNDINLGIVNILVGFAPLKPAEFVIIKIQQLAGQVQT